MATILLRFFLIGRLLGGGVFVAVYGLAGAVTTHRSHDAYSALLTLVPDVLVSAVLALMLGSPLLGAIPALAAGLAYWFILARCTFCNPCTPYRLLLGGILGGTGSGLFGALLPAHLTVPAVTAWLSAGAVAAAVVALTIGESPYSNAFRSARSITLR